MVAALGSFVVLYVFKGGVGNRHYEQVGDAGAFVDSVSLVAVVD